jgi:hypothetical protein
LKEAIVGMYGISLELKFHGKRGCGNVRNIMFKNCQEKQVFFYCGNLCCSCSIHEVPIEIFHVQPMLESIEGSGKA